MGIVDYAKIILYSGILFATAIVIVDLIPKVKGTFTPLFLSIFLLCYLISIPIVAINNFRKEEK